MKVFAYGCSFTRYSWPSYADILGLHYETYNRGKSGSGNERIFYHFMEDIKKNNISSNDLVILQWSGTDRFNYLKSNNLWIGDGNILLSHNQSIFKRIKQWYNPEYEIEKSINFIIGARAILKNIGCKLIEMSLFPIENIDSNFLENDLQGTYHGTYEFKNFPWKTYRGKVFIDNHPTLLQHYDITKRIVNNLELEFDVDDTIIYNLDQQIKNDDTFGFDYTF